MQVTKRKESKAKQQNNQNETEEKFLYFIIWNVLLECRKKSDRKKGSKEFSVPFIASEYTVNLKKRTCTHSSYQWTRIQKWFIVNSFVYHISSWITTETKQLNHSNWKYFCYLLNDLLETKIAPIKMVEGDCVNDNLIDDRKSGAIKLQIVPAQPKTLSHLPSRPPVDLAFHDLVYSVREGRRNRKYIFLFNLLCFFF